MQIARKMLVGLMPLSKNLQTGSSGTQLQSLIHRWSLYSLYNFNFSVMQTVSK